MPRVHFVKKAQKDYDEIKKGESYYWWKFRYSPKSRSKTRPTPRQLTRSEFWGSIYDLQDQVANCESLDELSNVIESIRELATEQDDKKNNMPYSLQDGPTGELLSNREEGLNNWADELAAVDIEDEGDIAGELDGIEYTGE